MNESQKLLLQIIKKYLRAEKMNEQLSSSEFETLYNEAHRHNLVQLLGSVCSFENAEQKNILLNSSIQIMMHYERQESFRKQAYAAFEDCGIDYIPLKGSIIKDFYHEPWHRTCGDIDILVPACDIDRAVETLESRIDCARVDKSEHDVVIKTSDNVVLELHYDLYEKEISTDAVWKASNKVDGYSHMYSMKTEDFILCHIAHMAKHFRCSGCGLRPFVDLYLMHKKMAFDNDELLRLLDECGLKRFYTSVVALTEAWFADEKLNDKLEEISEFILNGGVFGTVENKVAIKRTNISGFQYFWKRAFVSREGLAYKYPILNKHPALYLFCNMHRWYRLLFKGKFRKVKQELQANAGLKNEVSKKIEKVLSDLGL